MKQFTAPNGYKFYFGDMVCEAISGPDNLTESDFTLVTLEEADALEKKWAEEAEAYRLASEKPVV